MSVEKLVDPDDIETVYGRFMHAKTVQNANQMITWVGGSDAHPEPSFWMALHDTRTDTTCYMRLNDEHIAFIQRGLAELELQKAGGKVN